MNKDHGRPARKLTEERSAAASVRRTKRGWTQHGSTADRETATARGLVFPTADRRGELMQDSSPLASGLGQLRRKPFGHVRAGGSKQPWRMRNSWFASILCRRCSLE